MSRSTREAVSDLGLEHDPRASPRADGADLAGGEQVLRLDGIVKAWNSQTILNGVSMRMEPAEVVVISGANGAGKTTLLRIAAGLITPDQGVVTVGGCDPERGRADFQRRIGFLSAGNSGLYGRLKAEDHLELWSRLALMPRRERAPSIQRVSAMFSLQPLLGRRVIRLSMGQRQRLRLALAFMHGPLLVLLDEPATSLDGEGIAALQAALGEHQAHGGAALICLPSGWEQMFEVDRAYVLEQGNLETCA